METDDLFDIGIELRTARLVGQGVVDGGRSGWNQRDTVAVNVSPALGPRQEIATPGSVRLE